MDTLMRDVRFALAQLRRHLGFTLAVVLTLALGVGATTTIFSVVNAVVLRSLPFHDADHVVRVWEVNPLSGDFSVSDASYFDFAARNRVFAGIAAISELRTSTVLTGQGKPERLQSAAVTASFFPLLGVRPTLGRAFTVGEDRTDGDRHVAMLAHGLWQRRFAADPGIVGRTITLDGQSVRVVGVLPAAFDFPASSDVWVPLAPDPSQPRSQHALAVIARLKPSVTMEQARGDLARVARELGAEFPGTNAGWGVRLAGVSDWIVAPRIRRALFVLLGAVGFLLLIACANVSSLLIARAAARRGEIGIRSALGAGRAHLTRQFLTESAVLSLLGSGAGLLLAAWLTDAVRLFGPRDIPRLGTVSVDARVLVFTAGVAIVITLLLAFVPAAQASRARLHDALRDGTRTGPARGSRSARSALVAVEVAMATMLLVGAGLMIASFVRLSRVATGFRTDGVVTVPLELTGAPYEADAARSAFFRDVLARIRALPGVTAAGATTTDPLRQWGFANDVTPAERAADTPSGGFMQAGWRSVTPGFFAALEIPLLRGRRFDDGDRDGGRKVTIISETLARRLWPGADPIGKRLFWGGTTGTPYTVVGEVGDIHDVQLDASVQPVMYLPYDQVSMPGMTLLVKAAGAPAAMLDAVRAQIRAVDPALPITEARPLEANRAAAMATPRFRMILLVAFALAALALAAVGIYGVVSFMVSLRTREIGIRLALGARAGAVQQLIVKQGMIPPLVGAAVGVAGALALSRLLVSLLFETAAFDLPTYAAAPLLLLAVALAAVYLPARRAANTDPAMVLRGE